MKISPRIVIRYNHLPRVRKKIKSEVEYVITETGKDLHEHLLHELIEAPKSGRWYGDHRASAPGEPPAYWSGELADSIEISGEPSRVRLAVTAPHAEFLEVGTARMAARPFIEPAVKWARERFAQLIDALEDRVRI